MDEQWDPPENRMTSNVRRKSWPFRVSEPADGQVRRSEPETAVDEGRGGSDMQPLRNERAIGSGGDEDVRSRPDLGTP